MKRTISFSNIATKDSNLSSIPRHWQIISLGLFPILTDARWYPLNTIPHGSFLHLFSMTQQQEGSAQFLQPQTVPLRLALWRQSCLGLGLFCPDFSCCQGFLSTSIRFLSFLVQTKLPCPTALSTPATHQSPSELKWNCSLSNFPSFKSQCLPHHYLFIVLMGGGGNIFQRKWEETESIIQTLIKNRKQERSERNNNRKINILPNPQPGIRNDLPSFSKTAKFEYEVSI